MKDKLLKSVSLNLIQVQPQGHIDDLGLDLQAYPFSSFRPGGLFEGGLLNFACATRGLFEGGAYLKGGLIKLSRKLAEY